MCPFSHYVITHLNLQLKQWPIYSFQPDLSVCSLTGSPETEFCKLDETDSLKANKLEITFASQVSTGTVSVLRECDAHWRRIRGMLNLLLALQKFPIAYQWKPPAFQTYKQESNRERDAFASYFYFYTVSWNLINSCVQEQWPWLINHIECFESEGTFKII